MHACYSGLCPPIDQTWLAYHLVENKGLYCWCQSVEECTQIHHMYIAYIYVLLVNALISPLFNTHCPFHHHLQCCYLHLQFFNLPPSTHISSPFQDPTPPPLPAHIYTRQGTHLTCIGASEVMLTPLCHSLSTQNFI